MASGDTLLIFGPLNSEPPATSAARLDLRNQHPVLDFSDVVSDGAVFTAILPHAYSGGGLTIFIHFTMSSAVSGDVLWQACIERIGEVLDIDSDSFAAWQEKVETVAGTCGIAAIAEISFADGSQMDSVAAGETFRLKIRREGIDASDTASGDAELLAVEIKET